MKLTPYKILIVDDEDMTRTMVRKVLTDSGYEVMDAENGEVAAEACRTNRPDLVLMDVRMPVLNGFDACRLIRNLSGCERLPILMLTALDDVLSVTLAFEAGATDFVTKPINWVLLSHRLKHVLRNSETEIQLRASQTVMARAQKIAHLGQWSMDLVENVCHCSAEMREMLGLSGVVDVGVEVVQSALLPEDRPLLPKFIESLMAGVTDSTIEIRVGAPGQQTRHLFMSGDLVRDDGGKPLAVFGVVQDVTERVEASARLAYQANFDEITGLPNRVLFRDRLTSALERHANGGPGFALLVIETSAMQLAEISSRPEVAQRVLKAVVQRIEALRKPQDTLCRFERERFGLLLNGMGNEVDAAEIATRLIDAFSAPLKTEDMEVMSVIAIGITTFPADMGDVDVLQSHCVAALERLKGNTESAYQFYTEEIQSRVVNVMETHVALYRGLARGEFELHYQPLVELKSNRVVGIEALLRWNRPGGLMQMPDFFVPILEKSGLIVEAGDWILRTASEAALNLPLVLSVNLSPRQFQDPELKRRVGRLLEETGFEPDRLELEITEQAVLVDEQRSIAILNDLAQMGVRVALDDYGTGFSSLQRLKTLPLHTLKIDRFFVTKLLTDKVDAAIVRSTIDLSHELGIRVVAEGVEDDATMEMLREYGCDIVQGYGISRPMNKAKLLDWLSTSRYSAPDF